MYRVFEVSMGRMDIPCGYNKLTGDFFYVDQLFTTEAHALTYIDDLVSDKDCSFLREDSVLVVVPVYTKSYVDEPLST